MVIIMKPNASIQTIEQVTKIIESEGLQVHLSHGHEVTIIGVVGDKRKLRGTNFELLNGVDKIVPITESYKLVNKKFHPEESFIKVKNTVIGPDNLTVMAGPCAIESEKQLLSIAHAVKTAGATF